MEPWTIFVPLSDQSTLPLLLTSPLEDGISTEPWTCLGITNFPGCFSKCVTKWTSFVYSNYISIVPFFQLSFEYLVFATFLLSIAAFLPESPHLCLITEMSHHAVWWNKGRLPFHHPVLYPFHGEGPDPALLMDQRSPSGFSQSF